MRHPQVPQNTLAQALSGSETCNTRHRSLQVACGKVGTVAIHRCGKVPFDSQNMKILDQNNPKCLPRASHCLSIFEGVYCLQWITVYCKIPARDGLELWGGGNPGSGILGTSPHDMPLVRGQLSCIKLGQSS